MDIKYAAHAKVTVQLEVNVRSAWGTGCSIEQVYKQAADEANGIVRDIMAKRPEIKSFDIVKIDAIVTEKIGR